MIHSLLKVFGSILPVSWANKMRFVHLISLIVFSFQLEAKPFSNLQTNLFTESQYYLSPAIREEQTSLYSNMGFEMYGKEEKQYWFYELQLKGRLALDLKESHYLSIPSANIGWHLEDISFRSYFNFIRVSIGRYIDDWSLLDDKWHLGIWTPYNLYDPLRPVKLGHFGSAITVGGKYWAFTSFVGGLYFPDERPSFQIIEESNEVYSASRWVSVPNTNISFSEQDIFSSYIIEEPYLKNVLFQTSYMGKLLLGDRDNKWLSFSYADKPLNQIFFRSRSGFSVPSEIFESTIYYHSLRHSLMALESGFNIEKWTLYLGALNEELELVDLPSNWLFPIIPNYFFASASLSRKFEWGASIENFIDLALLRGWLRDPNRTNQSVIGEDVESIISLERLKIRDGVALTWSTVFSPSKRKWVEFFAQYWYSFEQEGAWFTGQLSFFFHKNLNVDLEVDILGKKSSYNTGFLGRYGNNDRIITRIRYVF